MSNIVLTQKNRASVLSAVLSQVVTPGWCSDDVLHPVLGTAINPVLGTAINPVLGTAINPVLGTPFPSSQGQALPIAMPATCPLLFLSAEAAVARELLKVQKTVQDERRAVTEGWQARVWQMEGTEEGSRGFWREGLKGGVGIPSPPATEQQLPAPCSCPGF